MTYKRNKEDQRQLELSLPGKLCTSDSEWIEPLPEEYETAQIQTMRQFVCAKEEERSKYSNSVTFWDAVPKHVSRKDMERLRDGNGRLPVLTRRFMHQGKFWQVSIRGAAMTRPDGRILDCYPTSREALVEDALRKLATQSNQGYCGRDTIPSGRSGVRFSIKEIRRLLEERGRYLEHGDIVEAMAVMQTAVLSIVAEDGTKGVRTHILGDIYLVPNEQGRRQFERRWVVDFNNLVTRELMAGCYRQYHFDAMMRCPTQLARWLYLYCVRAWLNASPSQAMRIRLLEIQRDSGLLGFARLRMADDKLARTLRELEREGVLKVLARDESRGARNALLDTQYLLAASREFSQQAIWANQRARHVRRALGVEGDE